MANIITLTTDFGLQDGFVGTMKGVILGINLEANIIDISHDIRAQDIEEAAFVLRNAYRFFPEHAIHVVVVDPGVGSERSAIIVETERYCFVGPDNGVFAYVYQMESNVRVTRITNQGYCLPDMSRTFHGRDVFAPVAAHLSKGVRAEDCGTGLDSYNEGATSEPVNTSDGIEGHIIHIDHFGNTITDISEDQFNEVGRGKAICIQGANVSLERLSRSYADVDVGEPLAIFGSSGLLEIAINGGNAAQTLRITRGNSVQVVVK